MGGSGQEGKRMKRGEAKNEGRESLWAVKKQRRRGGGSDKAGRGGGGL